LTGIHGATPLGEPTAGVEPPSYAYETFGTIKRVLLAGYPLREKKFEVYPQGCYADDTNITSYENVDIVIQLNQTFNSDISSLNEAEKILYQEIFGHSTYSYDEFWYDILKVLHRLTSNNLTMYGYKSVKFYNHQLGMNANLRVALQHRKYRNFLGLDKQWYTDRIRFLAHSQDSWETSWPKLHYVHGAVKNLPENTEGGFIAAVRMFKNARNQLVERGKIDSGLAPSYFLQCLLYNVPNSAFGNSCQATFYRVLDWLSKNDFSSSMVQSGIEPLFGYDAGQWRLESTRSFVDALSEFR